MWMDLERRRLHERRQTPTVPWGGFPVWETSRAAQSAGTERGSVAVRAWGKGDRERCVYEMGIFTIPRKCKALEDGHHHPLPSTFDGVLTSGGHVPAISISAWPSVPAGGHGVPSCVPSPGRCPLAPGHTTPGLRLARWASPILGLGGVYMPGREMSLGTLWPVPTVRSCCEG